MRPSAFGVIDLASKIPLLFTAGYLAKSLSPSIYGAWTLLLGLQILLSNLASLGFSTSLMRFAPSSTPKQQFTYLTFSLLFIFIACCFIFLILFVYGKEILSLYKITSEFLYVLYLIPLVCLMTSVEAILDAYLKVKEDTLKFFTFITLRTSIEIAVLLFVFKGSSQLENFEKINKLMEFIIWQVTLKSMLYGFLIFFKQPFACKNDNESRIDKIKFSLYGWPTLLASTMLWSFSNADRVLLSHYLSPEKLGVYSFGASLATYTTYLGILAFPLLLTRGSRIFDKTQNLNTLKELFNNNLTFFIFIVSIFWFSLALFHREILMITGGEKYLNSAFALIYLSFYYGIDQAVGIWCFAYHIKKKPGVLTFIRTVYFFIFLAILFIHLKFFNPEYLPLSFCFCGILYNLVIYTYAQNLIKIRMSLFNFMLLVFSLIISIALFSLCGFVRQFYLALITILILVTFYFYFFRVNKIHVSNFIKA